MPNCTQSNEIKLVIAVSSLITARKLSLWRLCFHRCLSVHRCQGGSWSLSKGVLCVGVSVQRGLCQGRWGLCPGCPGGLCLGGLCLGDPLPPYGNQWALRILLEFILVLMQIYIWNGTLNNNWCVWHLYLTDFQLKQYKKVPTLLTLCSTGKLKFQRYFKPRQWLVLEMH